VELVRDHEIETKSGEIVVVFERWASRDDSAPVGFVIETTSGYRAVFRAHPECDRVVCLKPEGHASYVKTRGHCHGVHHIEQVRALAKEVAATYGSAEKGKSDPSKGWPTDPRPNEWVKGQGWTGKRVTLLNTKEWAETEWAKTMEVKG